MEVGGGIFWLLGITNVTAEGLWKPAMQSRNPNENMPPHPTHGEVQYPGGFGRDAKGECYLVRLFVHEVTHQWGWRKNKDGELVPIRLHDWNRQHVFPRPGEPAWQDAESVQWTQMDMDCVRREMANSPVARLHELLRQYQQLKCCPALPPDALARIDKLQPCGL